MTESVDMPAELESVQIEDLIERKDAAGLIALVDEHDSDELTYAVAQLDDDDRQSLIQLLDPESAADVLQLLPESQRIDALDGIDAEVAALIVHEFPSNAQADVVAELESADEVLAALMPDEAERIRDLASYEPDTAGGMMIAEFFSFAVSATVGDVVAGMQQAADEDRDFDVQYVYVTDATERLVGVLRLRDLLMSKRGRLVREIMIEDPAVVNVADDLNHLGSFFDDHHFFGAPVVDDEHRLLGVLRASAVEAELGDRAGDDYNKSQGVIGGDELRTMPLRIRCGRRLAWLSLNIVLNIIAASIIAVNQSTLEAVIALAVFLPIISDMSGCSGNQAVAVSMRELSLNVARPRDVLRVWRKEAMVGVVNGVVLGLLIGGVAWVWQGNATLGAVVGVALALNTVIAVSIGGTVPLVLKGLKFDPALASGPILTTVTDMCGFFLVLTFAAWSLHRLV